MRLAEELLELVDLRLEVKVGDQVVNRLPTRVQRHVGEPSPKWRREARRRGAM